MRPPYLIHAPGWQVEHPRDGCGRVERVHELHTLLREAGLVVQPRSSFLWTDDAYGPYARELQERGAEDAQAKGRITADEQRRWADTLEALARSGDFYYGLVYHRILGTRASV
jgi:hypothetical protein